MQGVRVQTLVRELRSHMPCVQKTKIENRNKFSKEFKKWSTSKKILKIFNFRWYHV